MLSGTVWASHLEYDARVLERARGIPQIAVIDHWVNYIERFVRNGIEQLPDEVWISDDEVYKEAERCFPRLTLRKFPNEYLLSQVARVHALGAQRIAGKTKRVLYALEQVRQSWDGGDERAGEFQALDYTLQHLQLSSIEE